MRILTLFGVFSLAALSAFARLGETPEQLFTRYGKPQSQYPAYITIKDKPVPVGIRYFFTENSYQISCDVIEGKCLSVAYSLPSSAWTPKRFKTVLDTNAQEATWEDRSPQSEVARKTIRLWSRSDGAKAKWLLGRLSIDSPAFIELGNKLDAEANASQPEPATPKP